MERRIRLAGVFVLLLFLGLFAQLNNVQVLRAHALATSPGNPRTVTDQFGLPRGDIYSADGVLLATSVPTGKTPYAYQRVYPPNTATLFAQITGYSSILYGTYTGVEAEYNKYLTVHTTPIRNLHDLLTNHQVVDDVTLTIRASLQLQVAAAIDSVGSPAGAVVLDPSTGAVLAMYATPTFDPNPLSSIDIPTEQKAWLADNAGGYTKTPLVSNAFQTTLAPGSDFKVITTSAILKGRPDLAAKVFPTSLVQIPLPNSGGRTLHNYGYYPCGGDLAMLVAQSCDAAFGQLGMDLGAKALVDEATLYGFNRPSPIDLPGASKSIIPPASAFADNLPGLAYSAIGQENVSATVLQMAMAVSAVANGGVIMTPHVMAQIRDSQGNLVTSYVPTPFSRVMSAQNAAQLSTFMQGVVTNPLGTAYGIFPPAWNVGAKTGTAQTGHNENNDWMVAFAPASHPQVAVAVAVPFQAPGTVGATVAGPLVKKIIGAALGLGG